MKKLKLFHYSFSSLSISLVTIHERSQSKNIKFSLVVYRHGLWVESICIWREKNENHLRFHDSDSPLFWSSIHTESSPCWARRSRTTHKIGDHERPGVKVSMGPCSAWKVHFMTKTQKRDWSWTTQKKFASVNSCLGSVALPFLNPLNSRRREISQFYLSSASFECRRSSRTAYVSLCRSRINSRPVNFHMQINCVERAAVECGSVEH